MLWPVRTCHRASRRKPSLCSVHSVYVVRPSKDERRQRKCRAMPPVNQSFRD